MCAGLLRENTQNSSAVTSIATEYTRGTTVQVPAARIIAGATNLVSAAPELPAPKIPIARPWRERGNQRAT
ncbi:hypothetical protein D3C81_2162190 [compost metagenome]